MLRLSVWLSFAEDPGNHKKNHYQLQVIYLLPVLNNLLSLKALIALKKSEMTNLTKKIH